MVLASASVLATGWELELEWAMVWFPELVLLLESALGWGWSWN
jgi:hypothetical protein